MKKTVNSIRIFCHLATAVLSVVIVVLILKDWNA